MSDLSKMSVEALWAQGQRPMSMRWISDNEIISELTRRTESGMGVVEAVAKICRLCEVVDHRASASDGPIPRTLDAMTKDERREMGNLLSDLYKAHAQSPSQPEAGKVPDYGVQVRFCPDGNGGHLLDQNGVKWYPQAALSQGGGA